MCTCIHSKVLGFRSFFFHRLKIEGNSFLPVKPFGYWEIEIQQLSTWVDLLYLQNEESCSETWHLITGHWSVRKTHIFFFKFPGESRQPCKVIFFNVIESFLLHNNALENGRSKTNFMIKTKRQMTVLMMLIRLSPTETLQY